MSEVLHTRQSRPHPTWGPNRCHDQEEVLPQDDGLPPTSKQARTYHYADNFLDCASSAVPVDTARPPDGAASAPDTSDAAATASAIQAPEPATHQRRQGDGLPPASKLARTAGSFQLCTPASSAIGSDCPADTARPPGAACITTNGAERSTVPTNPPPPPTLGPEGWLLLQGTALTADSDLDFSTFNATPEKIHAVVDTGVSPSN